MKAGARMVLLALSMAGLALASPVAMAQQSKIDAAVFEQGRQLYDAHCVMCHQAGGVGLPPHYPALAGNDRLNDLNLIVSIVRNGQGGMFAFPGLTVDEIVALAAYIRQDWDNTFGAVSADQVTTILAAITKPAVPKVSVWSGVYTAAQSKRGEALYSAVCKQCHGLRLNGGAHSDQPSSPALARETFLRKWAGRTVATLFIYIRATMPLDNPNRITEQDSIDAVAHMFAVSEMPAGGKALPSDRKALEGIVIEVQPK